MRLLMGQNKDKLQLPLLTSSSYSFSHAGASCFRSPGACSAVPLWEV